MVWGIGEKTADKFIRSGIANQLASCMNALTPHYLLFSESTSCSAPTSRPWAGGRSGRWRFVLETVDGDSKLEASDEEDGSVERLELLAVVRGMEAIPQPAKVTLITSSRYVSRGLRFGLVEWRENGWQWERFGEMSEIANADLWQRLDRALSIHQVQYRMWRFDQSHGHESSPVPAPHYQAQQQSGEKLGRIGTRRAIEGLRTWWRRPRAGASLCAS
jgi:ribonuclease HI